MSTTFVYYKDTNTDTVVQAELGSLLKSGEVVQSVELGSPTPVTVNPLQAELQEIQNATITVKLTGGGAGLSYGIDATVTTQTRKFGILLAVTCNTQAGELIPYQTRSPDAFKDLVDTVQAGDSVMGTCVFSYPVDVDPSGGFVLYELLSEDGTVYAAGNAFEYKVEVTGFSNNVLARAVIVVPSDIPPTMEGQKYQLRWTIQRRQPDGSTVREFQGEAITVVGLVTVPVGVQPQVEMQGDPATLELVTDQMFDRVGISLYQVNLQLVPLTMISDTSKPATDAPVKVASGWYYAGVLDTTNLKPSVKPYSVVWKFWESKYPARVYTERADLFILNPSLANAIDDVKAKINKARTTLYGAPDLLFPPTTIMTWLRRAMDAFNGWMGISTNFTMTNALGGIREYWLMLAELFAIESQYLAEGEKAFDFQGQAISLNVDRTSYLDAAASKIQSRLDNELKPFKQNLIIRGNTGGDGSGGGGAGGDGSGGAGVARGATGAVGITISPASVWGRYTPNYWMPL